MHVRQVLLYVGSVLMVSVSTAVVVKFFVARSLGDTPRDDKQSVLGQFSETNGTASQEHFNVTRASAPPPIPTPTESVLRVSSSTPTSTPAQHTIGLVYAPNELVEGDNAAFTWQVSGPTATMHTTTVYYGIKSFPGTLLSSVSPKETPYTDTLKEFLQGEYAVPLQFVGNAQFPVPGTYFFRAYALIGGKHYWSGERTFVVKPVPKSEITVIDRPSAVSSGSNVTFTWDVSGPAALTGFTAIVAGRESKPGTLAAAIDIPKTPYTVLVGDFTTGTYAVPLRFVGSAKAGEAGVYYFRALAFINGKNIWSPEYSFTVQ